jgi:hypothetical protein
LRTWAVEKRRHLGRFANTIAHSIAALTSEKRWMTIKKKFIPRLAIDIEFFHSAFVNPCMM